MTKMRQRKYLHSSTAARLGESKDGGNRRLPAVSPRLFWLLSASYLVLLSPSHLLLCSGEGIDVHRYEYCEEEEEGQAGQWISSLKTEEVLQNESINLVETTEGTLVMNSTNYPALAGYQTFRGWTINKEFSSPDIDERGGWRYSNQTLPLRRRRFWEQLLVKKSQFEQASVLITHFQSKFRAINISFIRRALGPTHEYHIQMALESQRISTDLYSSYNLQFNDPPAWSCVPSSSLSSHHPPPSTLSPCDVPSSSLVPITRESFRLPRGWAPLHDFMFVTYPSRDLSGWQYSTDFQSMNFSASQVILSPTAPTASPSSSPSSHAQELHQVRRRLWIRTIVRESDLSSCRERLSSYINAHPRGHIIATRLYRQSHYRKRWCLGIGLLTDRKIHLFLDNNYQQHVSYALEGCEVSVLSQRTRDPHSQSPSPGPLHDPPHPSESAPTVSSFPFLGKPISPRRFHLFGLKYLTTLSSSLRAPQAISSLTTPSSSSSSSRGGELEGSLQCILSALTNKSRSLAVWLDSPTSAGQPSSLSSSHSLWGQTNSPCPLCRCWSLWAALETREPCLEFELFRIAKGGWSVALLLRGGSAG
jgi:hypothetical protein